MPGGCQGKDAGEGGECVMGDGEAADQFSLFVEATFAREIDEAQMTRAKEIIDRTCREGSKICLRFNRWAADRPDREAVARVPDGPDLAITTDVERFGAPARAQPEG